MDYEQHTLESNEREKAAKAERNEAAQRRKELDREVKLMEKNKKRINDKFTTLTTNLEKAKKDLAAAREKAAVTLSELDLERETIIELQQEAETHRAKEGEIIGLTDSLKELQEQVTDQKTSNDGIQSELKEETNRKRKTQTDLNTLERASKQVSKVMESLKMQFDEAKAELNISVDDRNQAERLLETERTEHEKLKEDLEFLQGTTIGNEEDTERKIKAMEIETPKNQEEAREMKDESDELSSLNSDLSEKIKDARIESVQKAANETLPEANTSEAPGATIGSSIIVKNLTKETEHNFELVNPDQVDPKNGKIPLTNPIGKALEGAKEGDEVKVGPNLFKVLKLK
jgi:transcription elongation factor GreA